MYILFPAVCAYLNVARGSPYNMGSPHYIEQRTEGKTAALHSDYLEAVVRVKLRSLQIQNITFAAPSGRI